jgi:hypothetical protein
MMMMMSAMDVLSVALVTLPIISGLSIFPNTAEVCNSASLEAVVGIPADQVRIGHARKGKKEVPYCYRTSPKFSF